MGYLRSNASVNPTFTDGRKGSVRFVCAPTMKKKRIAFVGTGGRALSFIEPLATTYRDTNELVGLCDVSATRMGYYNRMLAGELGYHAVPTYPASRFDAMLVEQTPDIVFVCSRDDTHHDYIVRAMHAGCDVITEK